MAITIKSAEDIAEMRVACRLAAEVLDYIEPFVKPGITTAELDQLCHDYMVDVQGCIPAPLNYAPPGYAPYPKSICASVNHQVCHGVPNDRALKKGDIVNNSDIVDDDDDDDSFCISSKMSPKITLSVGWPRPPAGLQLANSK